MISRRMLRIKVIKALYMHLKSESDSLMASEKTLIASIDKTYDLYFQMLSLVVELAHYAESDSVNDHLAAHKLTWAKYPELIRMLYNQLEQTPYYKKYMASQERSFREDLALVMDFYTNELEDCEKLEEALDEQSILWNDDLGFALVMVTRTLSNMRSSHKEVKVLPKFKSEEDLDYATGLFENAAVNFDSHLETIEQYTRNWDVERIAFMDNIIMVTALAELVSCPSIPVKVTLDEYIEIAKYYSTQSSSTFINGILDKVTISLKESGKINKSGRGLI